MNYKYFLVGVAADRDAYRDSVRIQACLRKVSVYGKIGSCLLSERRVVNASLVRGRDPIEILRREMDMVAHSVVSSRDKASSPMIRLITEDEFGKETSDLRRKLRDEIARKERWRKLVADRKARLEQGEVLP